MAGDEQRGDGGRALERVHVVGRDRPLAAYADQARQVGAAGGDPQRPHLARPDPRPVRADALDPEPAGGVDQVGLGQRDPVVVVEVTSACSRPSVEVTSTPPPSTPATSAGDLRQVAALEHDVGEGGVEGVDARQRRRGVATAGSAVTGHHLVW